MATRQNSSSGKQKSPRVQVVLPEELCSRLTALAEKESRTVSNMAKVFIQEGIHRLEMAKEQDTATEDASPTKAKLLSSLETQQPRRLRGAPLRIKYNRT